VASGLLLAWGSSASPVTNEQASAATKVCGALTADRQFSKEKSLIGVAHACEHLRERQFANTPAHAAVASHSRAAAASKVASAAPADVGSWSTPTNPGTKTIGITSVVLHTGKVLLFGGYAAQNTKTAAFLFDPVTGTGHEVTAPAPVFCGSVTPLSDGRILSVGGELVKSTPKGLKDLWLFDPISEQWIRQPDTPLGRYYPTSTRLPNGKVVIAAGTQLDGQTKNPTVELYTPPPNGGSTGTLQVVGPAHVTAFYPDQWVMPDGKMLQVDTRKAYVLNPATWQWTSLPPLPQRTNGAGSAGLLLSGGPGGSHDVMVAGGGRTAGNRTAHFDYSNVAAGWHLGNPMPTGRSHMNVVLVPDGSAFGIGGNGFKSFEQPQFQTMAYDPDTDTWTNMAVQTPRRGYHSTAVLLPDGRIMSAGDNGAGGGRQLIDYYSPPYLFKGPRPTITSVPSQVGFGQNFNIATGGPSVSRAVLMAPGATTHAVEMNARHIELAVTQTATGLSATAPVANGAPPGYYMLFVLTPSGIPSVAKWVHVGP
jgi:N-acetylneuraminic acid mutarotase